MQFIRNLALREYITLAFLPRCTTSIWNRESGADKMFAPVSPSTGGSEFVRNAACIPSVHSVVARGLANTLAIGIVENVVHAQKQIQITAELVDAMQVANRITILRSRYCRHIMVQY